MTNGCQRPELVGKFQKKKVKHIEEEVQKKKFDPDAIEVGEKRHSMLIGSGEGEETTQRIASGVRLKF